MSLFLLLDVRQWSKSEENSSLALWFATQDLEKQVGWMQPSESLNMTPPISQNNHVVQLSLQYRSLDLPMFKHYVGCATFIFLCIFLVQMLVSTE